MDRVGTLGTLRHLAAPRGRVAEGGGKVREGPRVLVVDPAPANRRLLRGLLSAHGYQVDLAASGHEALEQVARCGPDLILLDLVLPDMNGLELCRELREWSPVPLIVVSSLTAEAVKVEALDHGADDYLTRPFGDQELLARVRVALRRADKAVLPAVLTCGELRLDQAHRQVTVAGREVHLTPTEYAILRYLMAHAGRVVTYPTLVEALWGDDYRDGHRTLRVHIAQLRRKVEPAPAHPIYILTEPRIGYRFRAE